jgi:protein SCO1/2
VSRILAALALLGVLLLAAGCGGDSDEEAGGAVASVETVEQPDDGWAGAALGNPGVVPDFVLTDQEGKRVQLSDQRGKIVLLTFLYTQCPDICPLMADNLNAALLELDPAARNDVRVLAVSVDPERDTPATVRGYVKVHRLVPQFRYLIGSERRLTKVWVRFQVQALEREPDLIDHTGYALLIDRDGRGIVLYPSDFTSEQILTDLRRALES